MKLYLSSYHLGEHPERMLCASAENSRVGVIQNALDCYTDVPRRKRELESEFRDLRSLGLEPEELDLRAYFGKADELRERLNQLSYLWVVGGNTFVLRRAFALSNLDRLLEELHPKNNFVYAGFSAGACVLAPTLKGIHLADQPGAEAEGYSGEILWEGLNLIPYCIAPHYQSDHPESQMIDDCVAYFLEQKMPFIVLRDGEAIVEVSQRRT